MIPIVIIAFVLSTFMLMKLGTKLNQVIERLKSMAQTQTELAAQLKASTDQVAKIGGETRTLLTKVQELLDQLATQTGVTPELQAAADDLKAQLQIVDDLVPDAPTTPPTP